MARSTIAPDRKSTRLNSSHLVISYAVFCLKKKIRAAGAMAAVVLNPATQVEVLEDVCEVADYVLLMSVNPGCVGQNLFFFFKENGAHRDPTPSPTQRSPD